MKYSLLTGISGISGLGESAAHSTSRRRPLANQKNQKYQLKVCIPCLKDEEIPEIPVKNVYFMLQDDEHLKNTS